jgi:hypothetical protein
VSGAGLATVTGLAAGASATLTVTTTRAGYAGGSADATAAALGAALVPAFAAATPTADGFTAQLTNYDAQYVWAASATGDGAASVSGAGLATVTGLAAGASATLTVTTTRAGYAGGSADTTAAALGAALVPAFAAASPTADGFTAQLTNYDAQYAWAASATFSTPGTFNNLPHDVRAAFIPPWDPYRMVVLAVDSSSLHQLYFYDLDYNEDPPTGLTNPVQAGSGTDYFSAMPNDAELAIAHGAGTQLDAVYTVGAKVLFNCIITSASGFTYQFSDYDTLTSSAAGSADDESVTDLLGSPYNMSAFFAFRQSDQTVLSDWDGNGGWTRRTYGASPNQQFNQLPSTVQAAVYNDSGCNPGLHVLSEGHHYYYDKQDIGTHPNTSLNSTAVVTAYNTATTGSAGASVSVSGLATVSGLAAGAAAAATLTVTTARVGYTDGTASTPGTGLRIRYLGAPTTLDAACVDPLDPHRIIFFKDDSYWVYTIDPDCLISGPTPIIDLLSETTSPVEVVSRGSHLGLNAMGEDLYHQIQVWTKSGLYTRYQASAGYTTDVTSTFWYQQLPANDWRRTFDAEAFASNTLDYLMFREDGGVLKVATDPAHTLEVYGPGTSVFAGMPYAEVDACVSDQVNGHSLAFIGNTMYTLDLASKTVLSADAFGSA